MTDTMTLIANLQNALREEATSEEAAQWWDIAQQIEGSLYHDFALNDVMRERVQALYDQLTYVYAVVQEGLCPNYTSVHVALSAIHGSGQRTSTGLEGWPLR